MHSKLRTLLKVGGAVLALASAGAIPAHAAPVLPQANCGLGAGNNCLQFSDFTVYSLALLGFQKGEGTLGPGDTYYVESNGINLQNALVIGTGISGAGSSNQDKVPGAADDAFDLPNKPAGDDSIGNFLMLQSGEPNPAITGDNAAKAQTTVSGNAALNGTLSLWDIQTAALLSYLNGEKMAFYFNLNQRNSDNTYLAQGQDMLAFMAVIFSNTSTGAQARFRLDGNDCGGGPGSCVAGVQNYGQNVQPAGVNDILPNAGDSWAYVHGQICVAPDGSVATFATCTTAQDSLGYKTVNQNLGATPAAFALYSNDAQNALLSGNYDMMSVDLRMAAVDNGYEQLFILPTTLRVPPPPGGVPEPATIALFGFGIAGAAAFTARRRKIRA